VAVGGIQEVGLQVALPIQAQGLHQVRALAVAIEAEEVEAMAVQEEDNLPPFLFKFLHVKIQNFYFTIFMPKHIKYKRTK